MGWGRCLLPLTQITNPSYAVPAVVELSAGGDVGNRGCDPVHREQGMLCGLVGGGSQVAPDHGFQMGQMKLCKFDFFSSTQYQSYNIWKDPAN